MTTHSHSTFVPDGTRQLTASTSDAAALITSRWRLSVWAAYTTPHHARHLLAVLLIDATREIIDLRNAAVAIAEAAASVSRDLAALATRGPAADQHTVALEQLQAAHSSLVRIQAATAHAELACERLRMAWVASVDAGAEQSRCTHGADCTLHPTIEGPHNLDLPWAV